MATPLSVLMALLAWRRRSRVTSRAVVAPAAQLVTDEATVIRLVVERAQAQLDTQLASDDAMDLKALGVLGADAVAIGVLVAANPFLPFWWAPTIALGAASILLLWVVWPVELDDGPEWRAWYERFGGGSPLEVGRQMLADLADAVAVNGVKASAKGRLFKAGFVVMLVGLIGSVVVALVR